MTTVDDTQVAALRAQLRGEYDEYRRLADGFRDQPANEAAYATLVNAAYYVAVHDRFSAMDTGLGAAKFNEVIEFVATMRNTGDGARRLDAERLERIILSVLLRNGHEAIDDVDANTRLQWQYLVLFSIVQEQDLRDAELDRLLARARWIATEVLAPLMAEQADGTR